MFLRSSEMHSRPAPDSPHQAGLGHPPPLSALSSVPSASSSPTRQGLGPDFEAQVSMASSPVHPASQRPGAQRSPRVTEARCSVL